MDLREIGWDGVDWINLTQDRVGTDGTDFAEKRRSLGRYGSLAD
jgi:hypothetical protein